MQKVISTKSDVRGGKVGGTRHSTRLVRLPCTVLLANAESEATKRGHDNKFWNAVALVELSTVSKAFRHVDEADANMWRDCPRHRQQLGAARKNMPPPPPPLSPPPPFVYHHRHPKSFVRPFSRLKGQYHVGSLNLFVHLHLVFFTICF